MKSKKSILIVSIIVIALFNYNVFANSTITDPTPPSVEDKNEAVTSGTKSETSNNQVSSQNNSVSDSTKKNTTKSTKKTIKQNTKKPKTQQKVRQTQQVKPANTVAKEPENVVVNEVPAEVEVDDYKINNIGLFYVEGENQQYNIELSPEFKNDVYKYNCKIDEKINNIEANVDAGKYKDNVEITGNKDIPEGKSTITITLKADGKYSKVYVIEVQKGNVVEEKIEQNTEKQSIFNDWKKLIIPAILVLLMIIITIKFIKFNIYNNKHMKIKNTKKQKKEIDRARDRKLNVMINKLKIDEDDD